MLAEELQVGLVYQQHLLRELRIAVRERGQFDDRRRQRRPHRVGGMHANAGKLRPGHARRRIQRRKIRPVPVLFRAIHVRNNEQLLPA